MVFRICLFLLLSLSFFGFGSDQKPKPVSREFVEGYLDTYYQFQEFEKLRAYYTENSVMEDPVSDVRVVGGEQIIDSLKTAFGSFVYKFQRLHPLSAYTSANGWVVVNSVTHFIVSDSEKPEQKPIQITCPGLVVLKVVEGKVLIHRDYPDYAYMDRQVAEQRPDQPSPKLKPPVSKDLLDSYLHAYFQFAEFEQLVHFYTEKTVFEAAPIDTVLTGNSAILAGLTKAYDGMKFSTTDVYYLSRFRSREGWAVVNVIYSCEAVTTVPDGKTSGYFSVPMTLVLRFVDGKVVVHREYMDFKTVSHQMEAAQNSSARAPTVSLGHE